MCTDSLGRQEQNLLYRTCYFLYSLFFFVSYAPLSPDN